MLRRNGKGPSLESRSAKTSRMNFGAVFARLLTGPGIVIACWAAIASIGCHGNADAIRAELAARRASWQRELGTLKSQQGGLRARLEGQLAGEGSQRSVRAAVGGIGQSLVDVETQMRQVDPRVEQAIERGEDASKILEEECARMDGYLQALAAGVKSASDELDEWGRQATKKTEGVE